MPKTKPTYQIYFELQQAYDHFNKELFQNKLPDCILLLDNKNKRTYGYYCYEQFVNDLGESCDAIALNPQHFATRKIIEVMQTIVHEMTHLWQYHLGDKNSRQTYHNAEWGNKMESIGLMPSSTGQPGGKKTGQFMSDYPIEGSLFLQSCERFITPEYKISWQDRFSVADSKLSLTTTILGLTTDEQTTKPKNNKSLRKKYTCTNCKTNIWGKPSLSIICGSCEVSFEEKI